MLNCEFAYELNFSANQSIQNWYTRHSSRQNNTGYVIMAITVACGDKYSKTCLRAKNYMLRSW